MSAIQTLRSAVKRAVRPVYVKTMLLRERRQSGVVWNPLDDGYHQRPTDTYAQLRERDPIHFSPLLNAWVFSRHEDCDAILRDHKRFSNDSRNAHTPANDRAANLNETRSILSSDPPDHTRVRSLITTAFTPKVISAMRPEIEAIVDDLLDDIDARVAAGERRVDMLEALAIPLPITVIARMLGVPAEDMDRFKAWSDHVARILEPTITDSEQEAADQANRELSNYFDDIIEQRRTQPRDDLISRLLQAEAAGDKLSHRELLVTLELVLVAGNETTTNLIGNGLHALLKHPEQLERLRREPELMESAIEEMLRYDSAVQTNSRTALEDVDWDGHRIRKGQQVIILLGAGNHDAAEFEHPDQLDITRGSKRHLSFGRGIHHCVGAPLARMEGQVAFERLLARYDTLRLAADTGYKDHIVLRGLTALPVDVTSVRAQVAGRA